MFSLKDLFLLKQCEHAVDDERDAEDDEEPVEGNPLIDDQQNADECGQEVRKDGEEILMIAEEVCNAVNDEDDAEHERRNAKQRDPEIEDGDADDDLDDAYDGVAVDDVENALHEKEGSRDPHDPLKDRSLLDAEENSHDDVGERQNNVADFGFASFCGHNASPLSFEIFVAFMIPHFP